MDCLHLRLIRDKSSIYFRNSVHAWLWAPVPLAMMFASCSAQPSLAGDEASGPRFETYGFIRFDAMYSDSRMAPLNIVPMWVESEDPDNPNAALKDNSSFAMHPRLTRVGMRFKNYALSENWNADVCVEVDFQHFVGGIGSRETPRMRLGYFQLHRGDLAVLGGQTCDLVSPRCPNINLNGVNWNVGNTGDRRPQLRVTYSPAVGNGVASIAAAAALTGAITGRDADGNGAADGEDATQPMFQGRIGVTQKIKDDYSVDFGVWGEYAEESAPLVNAKNRADTYTSWIVGFDGAIGLSDWIKVQGEGWVGEDLDDLRGGIGQGVNPKTGDEYGSRGGWAEMAVTPTPEWTLIGGGSMDDVDNDDITTAGERIRNETLYTAARYRPWKQFMVTLEYMWFRTHYAGYDQAINNHVVLHFMYFI